MRVEVEPIATFDHARVQLVDEDTPTVYHGVEIWGDWVWLRGDQAAVPREQIAIVENKPEP